MLNYFLPQTFSGCGQNLGKVDAQVLKRLGAGVNGLQALLMGVS